MINWPKYSALMKRNRDEATFREKKKVLEVEKVRYKNLTKLVRGLLFIKMHVGVQ